MKSPGPVSPSDINAIDPKYFRMGSTSSFAFEGGEAMAAAVLASVANVADGWSEPAYPGDWLRAWERVLATYPRAASSPRLDVRPGKNDLGCRGMYDPIGGPGHAGVVIVWPDTSEDRWDSLDTLVHELAHAWCPVERNDHGAKWLRTYCQLYSWLIGAQFDLAAAVERFDELDAETRDAVIGHGRGVHFRRLLATLFHHASLRDAAPRILVRSSATHTDVVVFTPGRHPRHRVVVDHASQTTTQVTHGSLEVR